MSSAVEQRRALRTITSLAERRLAREWAGRSTRDVAETIDFLNYLLPAVGNEYGGAASALAADYYDDVRERRGVRRRFQAMPTGVVEIARWQALAAWGTKPLYGSDPRPHDALTLIQGGMQRSVADQYRDTIRENSVNDPSAVGWQRVGSGRTCDFCAMLISRGAVYTEATADFDSHDHCGCSAEPVFRT